jgi:hypothetical protein
LGLDRENGKHQHTAVLWSDSGAFLLVVADHIDDYGSAENTYVVYTVFKVKRRGVGSA